jgi:WD40 repeat protein
VYAISDQGQFKIINVQNGVQLSEVNLETQLRLLELNSLDVSPVKGIKAQTKPLVSMQLVWNDHIKQVIACDDESYMIFDDNDETPMLLRRVTGAHQEEICIVKYSFHLSLVATGCVNGELAIWDYESS